MAEVALSTRLEALRRRRGRRRTCRLPSRTASSSCCSARPAPARRRRCASSPGWRRPTRARIDIGGRDVTRRRPAARDVAFVFQQYSLYPHLSVFDNLAFPLRSPLRPHDRGRDPASASPRSRRLLRIDDKLQNPATRLSGGEMQRVAIGRALVRKPSIYLMDEPLSSLDAKLRADLRLELKRIQPELGATILYVTHDQIEAMTMADRIGVLDGGRLVQIGTPREIYEDPANDLCRDPPRPARRSTSCRAACCRTVPAPAPDHDDRRAHRAHLASSGANGHAQGTGRLDRASGRPEPPASRRWAARSS